MFVRSPKIMKGHILTVRSARQRISEGDGYDFLKTKIPARSDIPHIVAHAARDFIDDQNSSQKRPLCLPDLACLASFGTMFRGFLQAEMRRLNPLKKRRGQARTARRLVFSR